ncbi:MAG: class I SAM-dependent rRNA methyltransferase [Chloroflexales bacterium]|nr:class I SAM-dependent rRNA methyltransferase [Chloroflexales bacterium]
MPTVVLRPGRERPVQQRHPWVFSGAVAGVQGYVGRGDVVDVATADGEWLARGTWSSDSQIRARLFTWNADEPLDNNLLRRRIERAVAARQPFLAANPGTDCCRLVYAESDGLPGLIVDRYGPYLVALLLTQGASRRADELAALLAEIVAPKGIYERSDSAMLEKEDLPPREGPLWGEEPPEEVVCQHAGRRFAVNLRAGQKTGFYLDQSENRRRVAAYCAGADVLSCFSYTGGFEVWAAAAGAAHITAVDSSGPALATLGQNMRLNGAAPVESIEGDVFRVLRQYRTEARTFDVVILDPPKFAHNQGQLDRATRGYKDINLIAMQILRPGGLLATFSCSGLVSADLFQKVVFGAALDAQRDAQIVERLGQSPDHPVLLSFPEGEYLKGLICRVW